MLEASRSLYVYIYSVVFFLLKEAPQQLSEVDPEALRSWRAQDIRTSVSDSGVRVLPAVPVSPLVWFCLV